MARITAFCGNELGGDWSNEHGAESGPPEGFPSGLPHHRTCGSAYGGSWQSLRNDAALFLCHSSRCPVTQPIGFNVPGTRPPMVVSACQVQPFPSVSPSGLFVTGSFPSVLRPLLTPVPARQSLLTAAPTVAGRLGLQASLRQDLNSGCTTGPVIAA